MPTCFVIQPFDKDKFDRRYEDSFAPAIENAGLTPYRVDRDPSVNIPIEEIENSISEAEVCFAEISTDNPNVWFELGFAIARKKDICMVCSDERTSKFPFDVQHRAIIQYTTSSRSDFEKLSNAIEVRIKALIEKQKKLGNLSVQSPIKDTEGLSEHEIVTLCTIMENRSSPASGVGFWDLSKDMERIGYNRLAVNIGIEKLMKKHLVGVKTEHDINGEEYQLYNISESGISWLLENEEKLNLKVPPKEARLDSEIPF